METLQLLFNVALSFVVLLVGWWNKLVWDSLKELREEKERHAREHNDFRILVATEYLKKNDLEKLFDGVYKRLEKLDTLDAVFSKDYVTKDAFDKKFDGLLLKWERLEAAIVRRG